MQEVLSNAMAMHKAGQLGPAAQLYQKVLAAEPDNAEALHLLGVLHHQQGDHARGRRVDRPRGGPAPECLRFHANLAEAYRAPGNSSGRSAACRMALRLKPDYPEALCNLGLALQGWAGRRRRSSSSTAPCSCGRTSPRPQQPGHRAARTWASPTRPWTHFRRAVELDPSFAPARTNLGPGALDSGQAEEALPHCHEAVRLQPKMAALHHNLGNVLRVLERSSRPGRRTWRPCGWTRTWPCRTPTWG